MESCTCNACTCNACIGACYTKPGWFLPGEAEKAAGLLGVSLEELFRTKLGVDWWDGDNATFLLSPATTSMEAGEEFPGNPQRCVHLLD